HWHSNGADVWWKPRSFAGSVIAAAGKSKGERQQGCDCCKFRRRQIDCGKNDRRKPGARVLHALHCTFPCGRTAARTVAQSAAVRAERRRLSAAAQSQKPFSWAESRRTETMMSSLPATLTLLGESSGARAICVCSPARTWVKSPR